MAVVVKKICSDHRGTIVRMHAKGFGIRDIASLMSLSRGDVKAVLAGPKGAQAKPGRAAIPLEWRNRIRKRSNGRCVYCGDTKKLQFDHITPLAAGGKHEEGNLQLACRLCNTSKGKGNRPKWLAEDKRTNG